MKYIIIYFALLFGNCDLFVNTTSPKAVSIKVFLEGAYNGGTMSTVLSVPLVSPYQDARTVAYIPPNITDWIFVEFRKTPDGATVASRSMFLRSDGKAVDDDGVTEYIFLNVPGKKFYIVIQHRNHIDIMSNQAKIVDSFVYDFTTGRDKYYGTEAALLDTDIYGMYAGDPDGSGNVAILDYITVQNDVGKVGYYNADCNMSGLVNATDYLVIKPNVGIKTNVP